MYKRKIKVLIFFDGLGCVSRAALKLEFDTRTLDILSLEHIDLPIDILDFDIDMLNGFVPDFIWASPPCETFSMLSAMKGGGNPYWETIREKNKVVAIAPRTNFSIDRRLKFPERITAKRELHTRYLIKTIKIINDYLKINPNLIWCIENPASGLMKYLIPNIQTGVITNLTTYCKYGSSYRKETAIFSNMKFDLHWCGKKYKNGKNTCHHTDSLHRRFDGRKQKDGVVVNRTYLEKSSIPESLCIEILSQVQKQFQEINIF